MKMKECWLCGSIDDITRHHVLNRGWMPKNNITIPLCRTCHYFIHKQYPDNLDDLYKMITISKSPYKNILIRLNNREKYLHEAIKAKIKWREKYFKEVFTSKFLYSIMLW